MNEGTPLRALHQQARAAAQGAQWVRATSLLLQAAAQTSAREPEYAAVLTDLRESFARQRKARAALSVDWYLGDARGQGQALPAVPPVDQARTLQAWGEAGQDRRQARAHFARAAELYEQAGLTARGAIARERCEDWDAARTLWSRLAEQLAARGADRYASGLARFNQARACLALSEPSAAQGAVVAAVHALEEAADELERGGLRERAFDCYQVLIAIGKHVGQFEHVLEGYVNVTRILREDHLRYYALQSHEEAIAAAQQAGELSAGATLAQELASYAAAQGMPSLANHAQRVRADLWRRVAAACAARGAPPEMAENALLAAVVSLARQGQFLDVGSLYAELAQLDLEPARRAHYARAATRYQGLANQPVDAAPLPSHLRQDNAYPDVWHVDLVEWEQAGSASAACGDIILDRQSWSEITRRRALLARLAALDIDGAEGHGALEPTQAGLAELLGRVELYTILSPLETLYRSPSPDVRLAVIRAMERLMYKRTFVTVRAALHDPDAGVRAQACRTIEALRFPHAFEPLARIYRDAPEPKARQAALGAIARIDTVEAAELMLGVFQHEAEPERMAAAEALKRARGTAFLELVRRSWKTLSPAAQSTLHSVFQARGELL